MQQRRQHITPLVSAALSGSVEMVQLLLEFGGDPTSAPDGHPNPATLARMQGRHDIAALLTAAGAPTRTHAEET